MARSATTQPEAPGRGSSLRKRTFAATASLFAAGLLAAMPALADEYGYHMPVAVTPISHQVPHLRMLLFWVCVAIALVVFSALLYSIVKFRKSRGAVPDRPLLHSTLVEVAWTLIPLLILIGMAWPAARTLIQMEGTGNAELSVKVTG